MRYEKVIDGLIDDGHKKVTLYSKYVLLDDGDSVQQFFLIDDSGEVVARNLNMPGCYGWSISYWPGPRPYLSAFVEYWEVDLTDRVNASASISIFD